MGNLYSKEVKKYFHMFSILLIRAYSFNSFVCVPGDKKMEVKTTPNEKNNMEVDPIFEMSNLFSTSLV